MTVLVLAREFDPTADAVVLALARRDVPVLRTDLSAFRPGWFWTRDCPAAVDGPAVERATRS